MNEARELVALRRNGGTERTIGALLVYLPLTIGRLDISSRTTSSVAARISVSARAGTASTLTVFFFASLTGCCESPLRHPHKCHQTAIGLLPSAQQHDSPWTVPAWHFPTCIQSVSLVFFDTIVSYLTGLSHKNNCRSSGYFPYNVLLFLFSEPAAASSFVRRLTKRLRWPKPTVG